MRMVHLRVILVTIVFTSTFGDAANSVASDPHLSTVEAAKSPSQSQLKASADLAGLKRSLGGPLGVARVFRESPSDGLSAILAKFGMSYAGEVDRNSRNLLQLDTCPTHFEAPAVELNAWHSFDGEMYFVDALGRPSEAYKRLPPVVEGERIDSCQRNVGGWGDDEVAADPDDTRDFDGGHLLGAQLGGYGGRLNLVPQELNFNRGNWAQLESAAADCVSLIPERLLYHVSVTYPTDDTIIPWNFTVTLTDITEESSPSSVELNFVNEAGGGERGEDTRLEGVAFLEELGCNGTEIPPAPQATPPEILPPEPTASPSARTLPPTYFTLSPTMAPSLRTVPPRTAIPSPQSTPFGTVFAGTSGVLRALMSPYPLYLALGYSSVSLLLH